MRRPLAYFYVLLTLFLVACAGTFVLWWRNNQIPSPRADDAINAVVGLIVVADVGLLLFLTMLAFVFKVGEGIYVFGRSVKEGYDEALLGDRIRRGQCLRCGYNMRGNRSGVCPECGTPKVTM